MALVAGLVFLPLLALGITDWGFWSLPQLSEGGYFSGETQLAKEVLPYLKQASGG